MQVSTQRLRFRVPDRDPLTRASRENTALSLRLIFLLRLAVLGVVFSSASLAGGAAGPRRAASGDSQDPSKAAAAALQEVEQLRLDGSEESLRAALKKSEQASTQFKALRQPEGEIRALLQAADVAGLLNDLPKALHSYRQALNLSRRLADGNDETLALNGIGSVYARLANNPVALTYFQQALDLSRRSGDRTSEARSLTNIGIAYYDLSNMNAARDYLNQALKLSQALGFVAGQAESLKYLGYLFTDLSEPVQALRYYQTALQLVRTTRDVRAEAQITTAIGLVYFLMSERGRAIEYYSEAERIFRKLGDRRGLVTALNGRGAVYAAIASPRALPCHTEALQLSTEINDIQGQIVALRYLANVCLSLADKGKAQNADQSAPESYKQAIDYYQKALKLIRVLNDRRVEAYIQRDLGDVYDSIGEISEALGHYRAALMLSRRTKDRRGQAASLNSLGTAYLDLGQREEAVGYFSEALSLSRAAEDRGGESLTLFQLARIERDRTDLWKARENIEAAVQIIENLRSKITSENYRAVYFASIRDCYELYVDILLLLHQKHPDKGFASEALQVSERARARSLLELIKEGNIDLRTGIDPSLTEQERTLEVTLNAKARRRAQLAASSQSDEVQRITKDIEQLTTELDEVKAKIRSNSPRYAALTQPQPLTVAQIQQQVLDDDSVLLEYMLGEERSYVWAVTRKEISSYELPPRSTIETAAREFRELLTVNQPRPNETFQEQQLRMRDADAQFPEAAAALSRLLIGPVQQQLGRKRLLIVPDGALYYVPFQALTVLSSAGKQGERVPLLLNHEIVYEPSASALALVLTHSRQQNPQNSIAVFANPVFETDDPRVKKRDREGTYGSHTEVRGVFRDLGFSDGRIPALPGSRDEAEAILSFAPWGTGFKAFGFDANRASVTSAALAQYGIVHFATHGFVDYEHPELSGLILSLVDENGQPQDGYLRLHDIYNLKLSANLIVLSACNTGLGKEIKGEGLIGLTRGFMYAGAGGVAASLWKVDDEATAELMKRFYEGMFRDGLTPAAALRQAQIAMWRQERWRAPYFWAAFIIQGRYDQTPNAALTSARAKWLVISGGILSALLLAACLIVRRRRTLSV